MASSLPGVEEVSPEERGFGGGPVYECGHRRMTVPEGGYTGGDTVRKTYGIYRS